MAAALSPEEIFAERAVKNARAEQEKSDAEDAGSEPEPGSAAQKPEKKKKEKPAKDEDYTPLFGGKD